jgi:lysozyme family protein
MADFLTAFNITNHNEGGYSNNPDDSGGETYAGISRNNWPEWGGWRMIDWYKSSTGGVNGINSLMISSSEMRGYIQQFYKQNFWDVNSLDQFIDQQIANTVYDFGVNSGTGKAARVLQQILELPEDGIIGRQTLNAVNGADFEATCNAYNNYRKSFYEELAQRPGQHQFLASWLSRIKPYIS